MKTIEKCSICGEPYWSYPIKEEVKGVCPDCKEKADNKEKRSINKSKQFQNE